MRFGVKVLLIWLSLSMILGGTVLLIHGRKNDFPTQPRNIELPISYDSIHSWEIVGKTEYCVLYYRKHRNQRLYWSVCDGVQSSSVSVE